VAARELAARLPPRLPVLLVYLLAGAGLVRVATANWREGAVLFAGALLTAAAFRILLPDDRVGILAIRSKPVDVLSYAAFALLVAALALTITGDRLTFR
jgi:hypothetical protein